MVLQQENVKIGKYRQTKHTYPFDTVDIQWPDVVRYVLTRTSQLHIWFVIPKLFVLYKILVRDLLY